MKESFAEILMYDGHKNSLGRADEVIQEVLKNKKLISELYDCIFDDDAWVRMRAADAFEKICRVHPEWLQPFIDKFPKDLAKSTQASIQWHLAQIYMQVDLTDKQKRFAVNWLKNLLSTNDIDWIVAANSMEALNSFVKKGDFPESKFKDLLKIQQKHKSNAVKKRAIKILNSL